MTDHWATILAGGASPSDGYKRMWRKRTFAVFLRWPRSLLHLEDLYKEATLDCHYDHERRVKAALWDLLDEGKVYRDTTGPGYYVYNLAREHGGAGWNVSVDEPWDQLGWNQAQWQIMLDCIMGLVLPRCGWWVWEAREVCARIPVGNPICGKVYKVEQVEAGLRHLAAEGRLTVDTTYRRKS